MNMPSFDIRNFVDQLTPVDRAKNRYFCPVCSGNNFTIDPNSTKYQCWNGCELRDIREAIAPWKEREAAKAIRPKSDRTWTYTDADGNELIRTRRIDSGKGDRKIWQEYRNDQGQWLSGSKATEDLKQKAKKSIKPYRYLEVTQAIERGEAVFWVEGEPCADALWNLGIPATTTIGGSGAYNRGNYKNLFPDDQLVICPDADQTGIKYADQVASDYPKAQWLYSYPESSVWTNLPKDKGSDIADWIESGATKEQILSAIEQKRDLNRKPVLEANTEGVSIGDKVRLEISTLVDSDLSKTELTAKILTIAEWSRVQVRELWRLYAEFKKDRDQTEALPDIANELDSLLKASHATIDIAKQLPSVYAHPISKMAKWQSLRPECYLIALLTGVSASQKNGTELVLHRAMDFKVTPNIFGAIVAESSQKKSPIIKTMIRSPLKQINSDFKAEYDAQMEEHQRRCKDLKDGEERPIEPVRKLPYFTRATGEAILRQASRVPDQPLMWLTDELPSIFSGMNQYRGGKGSDAQDLLEYYDGQGGLTLRAEGVKDDVDCLNLGIFGGIQPAVLEKLIGDGQDADGKWSRFFFVQQPTIASSLPDDNHQIDFQNLLVDLYRKVQRLPTIEYILDHEAFKYFQEVYGRLEQRRIDCPNQALRAAWGKTAGRIGKLAINLHVIHEIAAGKATPDPVIPKQIIVKATKLAYFAVQQLEAIYCKVDQSEEALLSTGLLTILEFAKSKGVSISARDVNGLYERKKYKWKSEDIRGFFRQLAEMGYGAIEETGRNTRFSAFAQRSVSSENKVRTSDEDTISSSETSNTQAFQQSEDSEDNQNKLKQNPHFEDTSSNEDLDRWCQESFESTATDLIEWLSGLGDEYQTFSKTIENIAPPDYWKLIDQAVLAGNRCP